MGVFAKDVDIWTIYEVGVLFRGRIAGGTPRDPDIVKNWIQKTTGIEMADEIHNAVMRTLQEQGLEVGADISEEEVREIYKGFAEEHQELSQTNGFKSDEEGGLYIESRHVKSLIKENINILYGKERMGPTRKGAKGFVAERVFVEPERIYLGRKEPDGLDVHYTHTMTKAGPANSFTRYEYCYKPEVRFYVASLFDQVEYKKWAEMWSLAEENGIGAMRSQGFGKFDVTSWRDVSDDPEAKDLFSHSVDEKEHPRALTSEELKARSA